MSYLNLSFSFFTFFSVTFFLSWNFYDPKMKKSRVRSFLLFNHKLVLYFLFLRKFFISLLFKHNIVVNNSNTNINYLKQIIVALVMIWFLFFLSFFLYTYFRTLRHWQIIFKVNRAKIQGLAPRSYYS